MLDKVPCRHPLENGRFRFLKKILDPVLKQNTPLKILDAGTDDGWIFSSSTILARIFFG